MNSNQIIKTTYHLFATLFLLYIAFYTIKLHIIIKIILIFLAIFHLYDTWWFFTHEKGNAPI